MEEKLEKFLDCYSDTYFRLSDGTLSFIKSQVLKHAEDLLKASKGNILDSSHFVSLSASMEKLLQKVRPSACHLSSVAATHCEKWTAHHEQ